MLDGAVHALVGEPLNHNSPVREVFKPNNTDRFVAVRLPSRPHPTGPHADIRLS